MDSLIIGTSIKTLLNGKEVPPLSHTKTNGASVTCDKRPFYTICVIVFLVVLILSFLTPMVSDDFAYCFSWKDWTRIRQIGQIIPSMAEHRSVTNGRVVVHYLVQLLLMLPRTVYGVLNALVAVLLCTLTRRLLSLGTWKQEACVLLFGICSFCCFLPALGENILWLDGSLNYFWGLACSLLFLYPFLAEYLELPYSENKSVAVLRVLLAFIFGTWSENGSLVFLSLSGCLWLLLWFRTKRLPVMPLLWILAAIAGYVFLMTAPATVGRAGAQSVPVIGYNFRMIFRTARSELLFPLLINATLYALAVSFGVDRRLLTVAGLLILGGLLAMFSYVFAAYFVPRHLCYPVFLLVLASVMLLAGLCRAGRPVFSAVAVACLLVVFLLQFPVGVLDVAISWHKQQLREQQIHNALKEGQTSVTLENYFPYTSYGIPFELNPLDSTIGPNVNVADYYGLEAVYGVDPPAEG